MRRGVGEVAAELWEHRLKPLWMSFSVRHKWEGLCAAAESIQVTNPQFN